MNGLVAIPVYNEALNLQVVIDALADHVPAANLLFIDDGSSDGSHHLVEAAGLPLLRHPINLGYEEALRTGMTEVLDQGLDYVVFFDSDGQHQVADLLAVIAVYEQEGHDLVIGSRNLNAHTSKRSLRSFGTWFFSTLTTFLAKTRVTDVTCGLKLISRRFIPVALELPAEDMHAELIVGLARCGARVHEVPITVLPREAGESMYHFHKAVLYPAKTFVCLLGDLLFYRRLKERWLKAELSGNNTVANDSNKAS